MKQIRIILAESCKLYRQLLMPVLSEQWIDTIGEAESSTELIELLHTKTPDVVVLELAMCDINLFSHLKKCHRRLKIIVIRNHVNDPQAGFLYKHYTNGILSKSAGIDTMVDCIRNVHYNINTTEKKQFPENGIVFSQRETELIPLIMEGKSNKEIAGCLNICDKSIEAHKKNIFKKTKTKSTIAFMLFAIRQGLYAL